MKLPIILASASPARLELLKQVHILPDKVIAADIKEHELPGEQPHKMAERLAVEKGLAVADKLDAAIIISADSVPVFGRTIMRKAANADDVRQSLRSLSGRRHRLYTGVCIIKKEGQELKKLSRVVKSTVKFRKLNEAEIEFFCSTGEGIGKAGGYTLTGYAESFASFISGSFSNVIGLPLFETMNMLKSVGVFAYEKEE